jgi:hypothetical protein
MILIVAGTNSRLSAFRANLVGGRDKHFSSLDNCAGMNADLLCIDVGGRPNRLNQFEEEGVHGDFRRGKT